MSRRAAHTCIAILAATAAGCMGPRPKVPADAHVAAPTSWRETLPATTVIAPDWWEDFHDPVISELVVVALEHNDDLAVAVIRVREADARMRLSRSEQMPIADLDFLGAGRERTYSTVTGAGLNLSGYKLDAAVSYDLDLFGRLSEQTAAARAQLLASKAARDAVRLHIVGETLTSYSTLLELDASLRIARQTLESRRQQLKLLQHQQAEGYAAQISVSQADSAAHSVEQQLAQLELAEREQENSLSILLGRPPGHIERGLALMEVPIPQAPGILPAQLLRQRPDIYAAEQAVVAADHSLDSARAAFLPDIKLGGTVGRLDADVLPAELAVWSFTTSVLAPIYEGGKLRANQDLAAAERDQAAFSYRKSVLTAFEEVESALTACRLLIVKEQAATQARDADATTLRLAQRRYAQGYSSYQEVLDAERSLFSTELLLSETRAARFTSHIRLFLAIGGGWTPENHSVR